MKSSKPTTARARNMNAPTSILPSWAAFERASRNANAPAQGHRFHNDPRFGNSTIAPHELYQYLQGAERAGNVDWIRQTLKDMGILETYAVGTRVDMFVNFPTDSTECWVPGGEVDSDNGANVTVRSNMWKGVKVMRRDYVRAETKAGR